jgi:hypothetical protein
MSDIQSVVNDPLDKPAGSPVRMWEMRRYWMEMKDGSLWVKDEHDGPWQRCKYEPEDVDHHQLLFDVREAVL